MSLDPDDIAREAAEIRRLADYYFEHPHLVSDRTKQFAEEIRAAADALGREDQKKIEALNAAVRRGRKIWRQWLRRL
jgi:hypothetical protein